MNWFKKKVKHISQPPNEEFGDTTLPHSPDPADWSPAQMDAVLDAYKRDAEIQVRQLSNWRK